MQSFDVCVEDLFVDICISASKSGYDYWDGIFSLTILKLPSSRCSSQTAYVPSYGGLVASHAHAWSLI
jgi:hypothetical protein